MMNMTTTICCDVFQFLVVCKGVAGKDKALVYTRRYRSLLWLGFNLIEPWEEEWLWSCLSSWACTLLKFGVKRWWGWGTGTLDVKSPDMSVEELPLLPLVRLHSRNDWAALCTVILGEPQTYFVGNLWYWFSEMSIQCNKMCYCNDMFG